MNAPPPRKRSWFRRLVRLGCFLGVAVLCLIAGLITWLGVYLNGTPVVADALPDGDVADATVSAPLGGGLDGFESPYLGHTGSWNGSGGAMFGGSKTDALDKEAAMGLRWTFMCVYWNKLEPDGPVTDLTSPPEAWRRLDAFVVAAHQRGLNILMQAPVVGGNAGGPPAWAGRREPGKSAPKDMQAAADFAGRLAQRYAPGGVLASQQGWGADYGVRAWELDNEPESYRTSWSGQAGDYAEFVTLVSQSIRRHDPAAVIVAPGCAGGGHANEWIRQTLDAGALHGSPDYRTTGQAYSIGPAINAASFHVYEGMDSFVTGTPRTIETVYAEQRPLYDAWAERAGAAPPREYWHTEGNYDFLGVTSARRRADWRWQFFTRAFAAGVDKVCVMDASQAEQTAVRLYVRHLPAPTPMRNATDEARLIAGQAAVFVHDDPAHDGPPPDDGHHSGRVWVAWALPGGEAAEVEIPVVNDEIVVVGTTGREETKRPSGGVVRLRLPADKAITPSVMVVDRP
ncbi:hypothetical protein Pla123a_04760 [Posidoniimonas polymericola]|uniref:Glycoside hydrolase family 5 domain-containing protein n=1 Tax=Posidoniimonas polymericola TaxID=2528002 RepID=A0A5C5ZE23_9BACT|nr:hypothetical protein [Posidoniimonas polymericola]TWT85669.1 hypothetical protein Pla123a_04760 [Posidoniimonas polymericola]